MNNPLHFIFDAKSGHGCSKAVCHCNYNDNQLDSDDDDTFNEPRVYTSHEETNKLLTKWFGSLDNTDYVDTRFTSTDYMMLPLECMDSTGNFVPICDPPVCDADCDDESTHSSMPGLYEPMDVSYIQPRRLSYSLSYEESVNYTEKNPSHLFFDDDGKEIPRNNDLALSVPTYDTDFLMFHHPLTLLHFLRFVDSTNTHAQNGDETIMLPAISTRVYTKIMNHAFIQNPPSSHTQDMRDLIECLEGHRDLSE